MVILNPLNKHWICFKINKFFTSYRKEIMNIILTFNR